MVEEMLPWCRVSANVDGCMQIVVATNVAETSITIDDVTTVIDAGRVKEMGYDSARGIACLQVWPPMRDGGTKMHA